MASKYALAVLALVMCSLAVLPVADLSAEDDGMMYLASEPEVADDAGSDNAYVYQAIYILLIVLIVAGALHVKVKGMPKLPKRR